MKYMHRVWLSKMHDLSMRIKKKIHFLLQKFDRLLCIFKSIFIKEIRLKIFAMTVFINPQKNHTSTAYKK